MSIFRQAYRKLANAGVLPDNGSASASDESGIGIPLIQNFEGYNHHDLVFALLGGFLLSVVLTILTLYLFNMSVYSNSERQIVNAVKASGIDITLLSVADLRARLSYSPEEGRLIVDNFTEGRPNVIDDISAALRTVPIVDRHAMMLEIVKIIETFSRSKSKEQFLALCLAIDEDTAKRVVSLRKDIPQLLDQLTLLPPADREAVIAAGFPIRPLDLPRAELWRIVNMPEFPAVDLVRPLAALARADPADLAAVYAYLMRRTRLPSNH